MPPTDFAQIGRARKKEETESALKAQFIEASTLDSRTRCKDMRTTTGIKDTHQLHFLEKLFNSYKSVRGKDKKQAKLDAALASLPPLITNPVLRIKGE